MSGFVSTHLLFSFYICPLMHLVTVCCCNAQNDPLVSFNSVQVCKLGMPGMKVTQCRIITLKSNKERPKMM